MYKRKVKRKHSLLSFLPVSSDARARLAKTLNQSCSISTIVNSAYLPLVSGNLASGKRKQVHY